MKLTQLLLIKRDLSVVYQSVVSFVSMGLLSCVHLCLRIEL